MKGNTTTTSNKRSGAAAQRDNLSEADMSQKWQHDKFDEMQQLSSSSSSSQHQ